MAEITLVMGAGAATLLSPCGYALIPAYIGYSVGQAGGLKNSLARSALTSTGIVAVYALMAVLIAIARETVRPSIPHLAAASGVIILSMGVVKTLGVSLPSISVLKTFRSGGGLSFLLFGVGYGLGASGCNLPIFITVLAYASLAPGANPIAIMLSYATGVITPLILLGTLASVVGLGILGKARSLAGRLHQLTGITLIAAGAYLLYFYLTAYS